MKKVIDVFPARKFAAMSKRMLITSSLFLSAAVLLQACGGGGEDGTSGESVDPIIQDSGIAYVKRPIPVDAETGVPVDEDARDPRPYRTGGDLYYRTRALPSALETNLTNSITLGLGDIKNVQVSYDGTKLLFALHLADTPEDDLEEGDQQPTWNIWEYNITDKSLRQIIKSEFRAEQGEDVSPVYLPDGRILFSSTRQQRTRAILLDENKSQFVLQNEDESGPVFSLHVMNADGTQIQQLSFNRSNDLNPMVLQSGEILFSRWDNVRGRDRISLYKMNPDGSNMHQYYGAHSNDSGTNNTTIQFLQTREMPDGRIMALLRPFTGTFMGSDIVMIDALNYVDVGQGITGRTSIQGTAQLSASPANVRNDTEISAGGRYRSIFPLWDGTNRFLISWTPCRMQQVDARIVPCTAANLSDTSLQEASPLYALYVYDLDKQTQIPLFKPVEGTIYTEVVAADDRPLPEIYRAANNPLFSQTLADQGAGILHIRSVYDFDGEFNRLGADASISSVNQMASGATAWSERPARFLRVLKDAAVPEGVRGDTFGRVEVQVMREIVAYAPIEPDGSVKVRVPADVPLMISILDENGRRISTPHFNWIQVSAGETLTCNGCHDHSTGKPHGRAEARASVVSGETMATRRNRVDPAATNSGVDLIFNDFWYGVDSDFSYLYADLNSTAPVAPECLTEWNNSCRIVINYATHIHPFWSVSREVIDPNDGVTVLRDDRCTFCHSPIDPADGLARVPAAQLDLSDGASPNPRQLESYRELFYGDRQREVVDGVLQVRRVRREDANGDPILDLDGNEIFDTFGVSVAMFTSSYTARTSYFLEKMSETELQAGRRLKADDGSEIYFNGGTFVDHSGMLTAAELRLISEWLDIGGQYYNNSFDVP
ncbi:FIG00785302: hypothetical protein [hydrothermal vent metagenome]|uniref:Hydrazine synthase alpha subunit middle domain-containing protein n=1 Tax=hydrothermal vent metagenome TaxID=652676 RepID=A0A3B1ATC8_9ZZZZ